MNNAGIHAAWYHAPSGVGIMPIESAGESRVRKSFDSPTVYLDHWAIRLFSDDTALQDRLIKALLAKGGTLLLSHFSFAEFARGSSPQNCADAERFLQRALPNIFLTDFRLDDVLARERNEVSNEARFWPTADLPQLRLFAKHFRSASGFKMDGFIALAYEHRDGIARARATWPARCVRRLRKRGEIQPMFAKRAARRSTIAAPRTLLILGELLRGSNLDPKVPISENEVIDLIHATMPLNCNRPVWAAWPGEREVPMMV
jgi:hypothetical protein